LSDQIKKDEIKKTVFHPATLEEAGFDGAKGLTGVRIGPNGLIDHSKLGNVFFDKGYSYQRQNL